MSEILTCGSFQLDLGLFLQMRCVEASSFSFLQMRCVEASSFSLIQMRCVEAQYRPRLQQSTDLLYPYTAPVAI